MLILLTNEYPPMRGGVGTYCFELEQAARREGFPIVIWAPRKAGAAPDSIEWLDCGKRLTPKDIFCMVREVKQREKTLKGKDLLLASYAAHLAALLLVLQGGLKGCRLFSLLHGSELSRFGRNAVWRWAMQKLYNRIEGIFVVSKFTRNLLEKSFLAPLCKKVILAPCAVSSAAASLVRNPLPRRSERFYILTLARLHPRKGHEQFVQSLALLPQVLRKKIVYRIGGSGDRKYLKKIEALCAQNDICLEYLGEISEQKIAQVYASCDCYAMTSISMKRSIEGFGISYLEAGWHGKPSIGFRSGGVDEAVIDGETGFLFAEGDLQGVAHAVGRWIEKPQLLHEMGEAARRHAESFSWNKTVQKIWDEVHINF